MHRSENLLLHLQNEAVMTYLAVLPTFMSAIVLGNEVIELRIVRV